MIVFGVGLVGAVSHRVHVQQTRVVGPHPSVVVGQLPSADTSGSTADSIHIAYQSDPSATTRPSLAPLAA